MRRGIGLTVLVVVLAVGALLVLAYLTQRTVAVDLDTRSAARVVIVDNECGPVTLQQGPPGVVSTTATLRYTLNRPDVTSEADGDVVTIRSDCGPGFGFGLLRSADLVVQVPPGGSVEARTSAGGVSATGLRGETITLESSAGSVTAERVVASALGLRSSAGSVTGQELVVTGVDAHSSAGSVTLSWSQISPTSVVADSSAGSVTIRLPDDPQVEYRVNADSSAGSTDVQIRTDPAALRTIDATSSAGSVTVAYN